MRNVIDSIRDIWCLVSAKCRPRFKDDPYIAEMREIEHTATKSAAEIRQRRKHALVEALRHEREAHDGT